METLTLMRLPAANASPGVLLNEDGIVCWTLEPAWKENEQNVSCIPPFFYQCAKVNNRVTRHGLKIQTTFEVKDVKDRNGILFHIGNQAQDTEGCILLGKGVNIDRRITLAYSKIAFIEFLDYFANIDEFTLKIRQLEY